MEGFARSVRLIIGLGMVAAGTTLAVPTGLCLAEWARAGQDPSPRAMPVPPPVADRPLVAGHGSPGQPPVAARQLADLGGGLPAVQPAPGGGVAAAGAAYQPPAPPAPLPPVAGGLAAPGPDLSAAYRSTLEVPPPPLIDGQRPPPLAVGWTARSGRSAGQIRPPLPPAAATYCVRDGDDLTTIASRFYGTPAAARLIWEANRGRLADPSLLPIGLELVLPPPGSQGPPADRAVDPAPGQPDRPAPPPVFNASPWLGPDS